ncbi:methyl-accepting chemotaxis protein [Sphaerotilaceae bacterium SBD11-9]
MKLDNVSVSKKLWVSTLVILLTMFAASVWTQRVANQALLGAMERVQVFENIITLGAQWKGMTETNVQRVLASSLSHDPLMTQTFAPKLKQGIAEISKLQEKLLALATTEADKAAMDKVGQARAAVLGATKKIDELNAAGDVAATQAYIEKGLNPALDAYMAALDDFVKLQEQHREAAKQSAEETRVTARWIGLAVMLALCAASLGWMVHLSRSISVPLAHAVRVSEAIAAGDLTQDLRANRGDEIGQLMHAMNTMNTQLRGLVTQVRQGVESVSTASAEIATGNLDLSQRTEEQAANLEQTAASMEQLTATVTQNSDTARQANQLALNASAVAAQGGEIVGRVVGTMQDISASSKRIGDIIGVIDSIAFQTNILALNAAVEAARAGEQGRGFAVVASEVRSLAQRSAQAAREIKTLIGESVAKVETGSQLVGDAGQTMGDIVEQVKRVSDLIAEISAASSEQTSGIGQIGDAVSQLDQVTQQNAALVEESAAAADSLKQQAAQLSRTVAVFKVD